eukprot:gene17049-8562_t
MLKPDIPWEELRKYSQHLERTDNLVNCCYCGYLYDGGEGKYKRKKSEFPRRRNLKFDKIGSTLARAAAKHAIKEGLRQGGKAIARNVTKKALKLVAIKGAKSLAKGAAEAGAGVAIDAGIQKIRGSGEKIKGVKPLQKRRRKKPVNLTCAQISTLLSAGAEDKWVLTTEDSFKARLARKAGSLVSKGFAKETFTTLVYDIDDFQEEAYYQTLLTAGVKIQKESSFHEEDPGYLEEEQRQDTEDDSLKIEQLEKELRSLQMEPKDQGCQTLLVSSSQT